MSKTKLVYTAKGGKPISEMFRCMGDAKDHLDKLQKALKIISYEIIEVEKKESALSRLGNSGVSNQ